jgi:hypothetical protein
MAGHTELHDPAHFVDTTAGHDLTDTTGKGE